MIAEDRMEESENVIANHPDIISAITSVLSCDGKRNPDVMAANAMSTALMLSDIPWGGPIGMVCLGKILGQFIATPTMDELIMIDLNLMYACTKDKTLMTDVQAREISEKDLEAGPRLAHPEAVGYIEPQYRLAARAGKQKKVYSLSMISDKTMDRVHQLAEAPTEAGYTDLTYGKFERGQATITKNEKNILEELGDEESLRVLPKVVDSVRKEIARKRIMNKGLRSDGRSLDEVRPVFCESGSLPQFHGSSIFSRGDTQVLCTVTLGSPADARNLTSIIGPSKKRFMLHYSFPPFRIDEVGKRGGLNRRQVGHGALAEKALLSVLPLEDNFPYTGGINSEVMASDGSTSMATVCGGPRLAVSDGALTVMSKNQYVMHYSFNKNAPSAVRIIEFMLGSEIEVGGIYKGIVTTVKEYGAFVEFNGGQQGLLCISELSHASLLYIGSALRLQGPPWLLHRMDAGPGGPPVVPANRPGAGQRGPIGNLEAPPGNGGGDELPNPGPGGGDDPPGPDDNNLNVADEEPIECYFCSICRYGIGLVPHLHRHQISGHRKREHDRIEFCPLCRIRFRDNKAFNHHFCKATPAQYNSWLNRPPQ